MMQMKTSLDRCERRITSIAIELFYFQIVVAISSLLQEIEIIAGKSAKAAVAFPSRILATEDERLVKDYAQVQMFQRLQIEFIT